MRRSSLLEPEEFTQLVTIERRVRLKILPVTPCGRSQSYSKLSAFDKWLPKGQAVTWALPVARSFETKCLICGTRGKR